MATEPRLRAYLDTNVFLDAVEGTEELAQPAISLLDAVRRERGCGVTSEITLLEVLAKARTRGGPPLYRRYVSLLVLNGFFSLAPVSRQIIYTAAEYRERVQLAASKDPLERRAIDSIHVATALVEGCSLFVTRDKPIKVPAPLQSVGAAEALAGLQHRP